MILTNTVVAFSESIESSEDELAMTQEDLSAMETALSMEDEFGRSASNEKRAALEVDAVMRDKYLTRMQSDASVHERKRKWVAGRRVLLKIDFDNNLTTKKSRFDGFLISKNIKSIKLLHPTILLSKKQMGQLKP